MSQIRTNRLRRWMVVALMGAMSVLAACAPTAPIGIPPVTSVSPPTSAPAASPTVAVTPSAVTTAPIFTPTSAPTLASQVAASPPDCSSPAALTPPMTEGPFFKAGSPERASLIEPGMTGTRLILTGYVLTADCKPVVHALLDFWQANADGQYDNSAYTLRGHQFTDAAGRYQLETIVPGLYPGRTEHIHVKVQAPNGPVLTTQLFFPGVPRNQTDGIFDPTLVMTIQDTGAGVVATYNFVLSR